MHAAGHGHRRSGGSWTVTTGVLTDGVHTLTAEATDTAGNVSEASLTLTVTTDTVAPTAPSIDLDAAQRHRRLRHRRPDQRHHADPDRHGRGRQHRRGLRRLHVAEHGDRRPPRRLDAHHRHPRCRHAPLTAKATDTAGNTSAASASLTVTIDTAAPASRAEPGRGPTPARPTPTTSPPTTTPTLDGTAEDGSSVEHLRR